MSRHRKAQSLSLFPFLAVLICTMGVLVALLLLVVKQAEQSGKQEQHAECAITRQQLEDLELQLAELGLRNRLLEARRQDYQTRLSRQRDELGHLENEMSRVRDEAERFVAQRAADRSAQTSAQDRRRQEQILEEQQVQLQALRQALNAAQAKLQLESQQRGRQAAPVYSIVPMAAQSGTNRRPIYIECREDGLRLHPGGIPLTLDDFVMPLTPGNPLDAALLAYREYWRKALGSQADQANAYPLMVVRPSGAKWYSVARRAMSGWDQEFGYELIPEDWEVNFGAVDPSLVQHVQHAIRAALARQSALVAFGQATPAGQAFVVQQASAATSSDRALVPAVGGGFSPAPAKAASGGGDSQRRGSAARAEHRGQQRSEQQGEQRADPVALFSSDFHQSRPAEAGSPGLREKAADSGNSPSRLTSSRQTPTAPNWLAALENQAGSLEAAPLLATASSPNSSVASPPGAGSSGTGRSSAATTQPAASGPPGGAPLTGGSPPSSPGTQGAPPSADAPATALDATLNPQSLAHQRGTDWALPSRRNAVSAYHRPIVVHVHDNALVLPAGEGSPQDQTVAFSQSLTEAIDPLANAIWQRVDKWGYLGFGGYWKPVLELKYDPAETKLAHELQQLLEGSGLDVKHPEPLATGSGR
jgi:hypothetical protein